MPSTAARTQDQLGALVSAVAGVWQARRAIAGAPSELVALLHRIEALPAAHNRPVAAVDQLAQAGVAMQLAGAAIRQLGGMHAALWRQVLRAIPILEQLDRFVRDAADLGAGAEEAARLIFPPDEDVRERLVHGYERFLAGYDGSTRRRRGVYFTPRPLVEFMVRSVDRTLRQDFGHPAGLASIATDQGLPRLRILDPATGTGTFLVAAIREIHRSITAGGDAKDWNDYVGGHLLPRLAGIEILPAAYVLAHANLTIALADSGYHSDRPLHLPLELGCALATPRSDAPPATVILGNPPYAGNSANRIPWVRELLRGISPEGGSCASYYHLAEQPLGEKKLWLNDDYVKFLRLAHWHVERAGEGLVALVTNHGFLDNATHRGLRAALWKTFPQIDLLDLHGNAKNREQAPPGTADRNLFAIEQGVAVAMLARPPGHVPARIRRGDLWGTREAKLERLDRSTLDQLATVPIQPQPPHGTWVCRPPTPQFRPARRTAPWRLCDAMPQWSTAPVTARDSFVVAFTREELAARLRDFRDLSIADAEIRARWFTQGRSPRYAPGDTRGWKLSEARRALADDPQWERDLVPCLYRACDVRWLAYRADLVDWPRRETMRHLLSGDNLALIARRQSPSAQPANYFWVTDRVALDGVIRSDNRGTESLFPLWLLDSSTADHALRQPNFAPAFVEAIATAIGLDWNGSPSISATDRHFGPLDLFHYLYGLFFAPNYRDSFADELRSDFPLVLLPRSPEQFHGIRQIGQRLVTLHTQGAAIDAIDPTEGPLVPGAPTWDDKRVWVGTTALLADVTPAMWDYRIGAHQVLRKWLNDRRARRLSAAERHRYAQIAAAIAETIALQSELRVAFEALTECR